MTATDHQWVLIPGLGADQRLFANIADLLPHRQILELELPEADESIEHYAARLGRQIRPDGPLVLGGISFGGMLATILASQLQPRAVVLMASTPDPAALGHSVRVFERLSRVLPDTFAAWVRHLGRRSAAWLEPLPPQRLEDFKEMLVDSDLALVRRAARMIMGWQTAPPACCQRFHLHGDRDVLIPARRVPATHRIADGGHLINLTHPTEVRAFIGEIIAWLDGGGATDRAARR